MQETRGWNEAKGVTVGQRSKEYAHDYRYFPEPDLPPLEITREMVDGIRAELPELPAARATRFREQLGLSVCDADRLTASRQLGDYFESLLEALGAELVGGAGQHEANAKEPANWVIGEVNRAVNEGAGSIDDLKVRPGALATLIRRKAEGKVEQ